MAWFHQRGPPEALPLDTVEDLLAWEPGSAVGELCRPVVALPPSAPGAAPTSAPRLLACHDMRGGYGEDRLVQGGGDADFYFLRHWRCLDSFVYFSHRLVTIPPPGWVNAAHTHGVRVLGTLITEWGPGAANCARLFGSAAAAEEAAAQLAAIAQYHGFEGWLINIENEVEPCNIPHLIHFLRVLTEAMRQVAPGWSQVIWYDAVTVEGKLVWQNTLNHLNRPFFDACNAIWINYAWKKETPALTRAEAGDRVADVYMGVDCFGRGTYGGGGYTCDVALHASLQEGLSAALFATGWPFESDDSGAGEPADAWRRRDVRFWCCIEAAWRHGSAGITAAAAADGATAAGGQLLLWSNFSLGCGRGMWLEGHQVSTCAWYNLSLQALQPLLRVQLHGGGELATDGGSAGGTSAGNDGSSNGAADGSSGAVQAEIIEQHAFSGGSSVRVAGSLRPGQQVAVQLFAPAAHLSAPAGIWVRSAWVAPASQDINVRLVLRVAPCSAAGGEDGSTAAAACSSIELLPALSGPACAEGPAAGAVAASVPDASGRVLAVAAVTCSRTASWLGSNEVDGSSRAPVLAATNGGTGNGTGSTAPPAVWETWVHFVPARMLAEAAGLPDGAAQDFSARPALVLAGVDLLVAGGAPATGGGTDGHGTAREFEVCLGELCIEAAEGPNGGVPPPPPRGVQELRCSELSIATSPGPTGEPAMTLAAQLSWDSQAGGSAARCCHVWSAFEPHSNNPEQGTQMDEQRWLGIACADGYWVTDLLLPPGAAAVRFFVQPVGHNGLAQPLQQAAQVRASLLSPAAA